MKKITILFFLIIALPIISAASTPINVKTLPKHDVFISITTTSGEEYLKVFKVISDEKGKASSTFVDDTTTVFKVAVKVKFGENTLFFEKFGPYNAGKTIELELLPEDYVDPFAEKCDAQHLTLCTNQTDCQSASAFWYGEKCNAEECTNNNIELCKSETTCQKASGFWYDSICHVESQPIVNETIEEATEAESIENKITGFSIFQDEGKSFFANKIFWIIIASLIVLIIAGIYAKKKLTSPPSFNNKIKLSHNPKALEYELTHAERKLQAAQAEIRRLQNQGKIAEARRKLEVDKEYLHKLERGEI